MRINAADIETFAPQAQKGEQKHKNNAAMNLNTIQLAYQVRASNGLFYEAIHNRGLYLTSCFQSHNTEN